MDTTKLPVDSDSRDRLAAKGLDFRLIDPADTSAQSATFRSIVRGFLSGDPKDEEIIEQLGTQTARRTLAVFDTEGLQPELPVATVGSWMTALTVPDGEVPMWAISAVTVSPTHRRRGIARAMLEGELRAARDSGVSLVGLTASESTIYSRYGFGPATWRTDVTIDTRRAGWRLGDQPASVHYVTREDLAKYFAQIHDRARPHQSGDIEAWPHAWQLRAGLAAGVKEPERLRGVVYVDAAGEVRGALAYRIDGGDEWSRSRLKIERLDGETDEAQRALWNFALHHDLVGTVFAHGRPSDEPLGWMVNDRRAVSSETEDHLWLRILDAKAALEARSYRAEVSTVLHVTDDLGFASGSWRFATRSHGDAWRATVTPLAERPDTPGVEISVSELSAILLGGVTLESLAEAGLVAGEERVLRELDHAFGVSRDPYLSIDF